MKSVYGINDDGEEIKPPRTPRFPLPGRENDVWEIIEEGGKIPQIHREYIGTSWCQERRCHSTMTAMQAQIWGSVRAYAKLKEK